MEVLTSAPYTLSWNTVPVANGTHTLTAIARDTAGNAKTSSVVNVTVNNVPDTTPPIISAVSAATPSPTSATITSKTMGASFNGRMAGLHPADESSILSVSTRFAGIAYVVIALV